MEALLRGILVALVIGAALAAAALLRRYQNGAPHPQTFDRSDAGRNGNRPLIVEFTTPFCYECKEILPVLKAAGVVHGAEVAVIDARERPDLASKYRVGATPTILVVDSQGTVKRKWAESPPVGELEAALRSASARVGP